MQTAKSSPSGVLAFTWSMKAVMSLSQLPCAWQVATPLLA
jgi:hypothetical protein